MTTPVISFSDGIGPGIEDYSFQRYFFKNLNGVQTNRAINPYARSHIVDSSQNFALVAPPAYNMAPEYGTETRCCNQPTSSYVSGPRIWDDRTIEATRLDADLRLRVHRLPKKVTGQLIPKESENQVR